jgi:threonine dehydratase
MSDDIPATVTYDDVADAARQIERVVRRTPVLTSVTLDDRTGATVFLKAEPFQRAGAFKFRGAFNAISRLDDAQRARGVIAFSSGNHAQAVALAGRMLGAPVTIVMPHDAPAAKRAATEGYGARVVPYDPATERREDITARLQEEGGLCLVPPFDHPHVVAGAGTVARELIDDVKPLDLLLVPCGGGGLLSGSALSARALAPSCRVVGVEPELADDAARSFRTGTLQTVHNPRTIADGARTASLGKITFPLIRANVDDIVTVSEDEILRTVRFAWERLKVVVEPTGVLALAALLHARVEGRGQRVGIILSGGNVDVAALAPLLPAD